MKLVRLIDCIIGEMGNSYKLEFVGYNGYVLYVLIVEIKLSL